MANPLFSNPRGDEKNRPTNPLNEADKSYKQGYNTFTYDRPHYSTLSFADVTPFEAVECVEADVIPFGSKHHLRTYTLSSPMFDDLFIKKSYYMLDMRSILPINWDKIYREPASGSDVPDDANCYFGTVVLSHYVSILQDFSRNHFTTASFDWFIKRFLLFETIVSKSGLLSRFGYNISNCFRCSKDFTGADSVTTFDVSLDYLYSKILELISDSNNGVLQFKDIVNNRIYDLSKYFDYGLEVLRTYPDKFSIALVGGNLSVLLSDLFSDFFDNLIVNISSDYDIINLSRIAAYQLVCSEYFTRDKIDNINTSQIYLQNMRGLISNAYSLNGDPLTDLFFEYNGVLTPYDSLSFLYINSAFTFILNAEFEDSQELEMSNDGLYYLHNLFGIRKSLRYGDYFTGARPEPYSPLDLTAEVIDGSVSAVDVTRSILAQRFSNAVARTGRKFSDYLVDVMGGYDVPDIEVPRWLASKTSKVDGFEVENTTSENQGNIVTVLNSANSDFIYEVESGSPAIVIGVCTFSMQRVYNNTTDRFAFVKDRYDMYNKFFQFDGDQSVEAKEIDPRFRGTYAYQISESEYKQRFPICSGAWNDFLPAMFLIADRTTNFEVSGAGVTYHIDSFILRNINTEFDVFYSSLTGHGLCSRFHFMVKFENYCKPKRRMARTPSIL